MLSADREKQRDNVGVEHGPHTRWREGGAEHGRFQHRTQSNQRLRKGTKELGKIEILRGQRKKRGGLGCALRRLKFSGVPYLYSSRGGSRSGSS